MPAPFLSPEWMDQLHALHQEFRADAPVPEPMRVNLVVTGAPFDPSTVQAHIDTSAGELDLDLGHLDPVDLTVTVDYASARSILVDGDPGAVMQGFLAGSIRLDGDVTKVLALQAIAPGASASGLLDRLRDITA
jgi:hypothetical protein